MGGLEAILERHGAILGASRADLGPTWAPKRAQKGAQDDPKRLQNDIVFLIVF